jgi:hypothetical protein
MEGTTIWIPQYINYNPHYNYYTQHQPQSIPNNFYQSNQNYVDNTSSEIMTLRFKN